MSSKQTIKRTVESFDKWEVLKAELKQKVFKLWQMQFSYDAPEGFHAWFLKEGKPQVEVVTHNKAIQKDIVSSGLS